MEMQERVKTVQLGKAEKLLTSYLADYARNINLSDYSKLDELEQAIDLFNESVDKLERIIRPNQLT